MMKVHLFRLQEKKKKKKPQETILYPWQTLRHGLLEKESESQRRQVER